MIKIKNKEGRVLPVICVASGICIETNERFWRGMKDVRRRFQGITKLETSLFKGALQKCKPFKKRGLCDARQAYLKGISLYHYYPTLCQ